MKWSYTTTAILQKAILANQNSIRYYVENFRSIEKSIFGKQGVRGHRREMLVGAVPQPP